MTLTVHQQRCGGHFVSPVFVGESGGLFDGGEVFGGGRCVNVAHLYAGRGRRLDVAFG